MCGEHQREFREARKREIERAANVIRGTLSRVYVWGDGETCTGAEVVGRLAALIPGGWVPCDDRADHWVNGPFTVYAELPVERDEGVFDVEGWSCDWSGRSVAYADSPEDAVRELKEDLEGDIETLTEAVALFA